MQTDKYTKVILTLIAIGISSLGCGGGASLEEVNELRQEIAALKEAAVEQNDVEELRLEIAALRDSVEKFIVAPFEVSDLVRTRQLEIVNGDGKRVIYAGTGAGGDGNGMLTVKNKSGQGVIYVGSSNNGNGGYINVKNKTGEGVVTLGVDDYGNGEVGAWNRKGKGRVFDSK